VKRDITFLLIKKRTIFCGRDIFLNMPQDPQVLRNNTIHAAREALKNYPTGAKRPSVRKQW
jgi:hypothetical protein